MDIWNGSFCFIMVYRGTGQTRVSFVNTQNIKRFRNLAVEEIFCISV